MPSLQHTSDPEKTLSVRERVIELVQRFGWNATCYQIVNPGLALWFNDSPEAVIAYVEKNRTRVVAGAPVCAEDEISRIIGIWEEESRVQGCKVCYFGASGRIEHLLSDCSGYSTVVLGSQPVWEPSHWPEIVKANANIRAQLNRARNKGLVVEEWDSGKATNHPELERVLEEWLRDRGLPPLHFLVEPQTLSFLEGRRVFVARQHDKVVAFLLVSPIPLRNGWLTEQFPRGKDSVNGTVECMIDYAMRALAKDGADYVTMGLVPLSMQGITSKFENPLWLKILLRWVRAHGQRFYNFGGLEAFKGKLSPDYWEPIYAISNEKSFSFRSLYAIAAAFTHTSPILAVVKGLWRAVRQEFRWMLGKP